jgi:hypothetical protein
MNTSLTEREAAYVRRYCYEVISSQFGPGTIFDHCRDHCRDLEILAMETNIQGEILDDNVNDRPGPDSVPFPWESFEELHHRAEEFRVLVHL